MSERFKADKDESESFFNELIESQLILPEFSSNNTGKDYCRRLLQRQYPGSSQISRLVEIDRIIEKLKNQIPSKIAAAIISADVQLRNLSKDFNQVPLYINLHFYCRMDFQSEIIFCIKIFWNL